MGLQEVSDPSNPGQVCCSHHLIGALFQVPLFFCLLIGSLDYNYSLVHDLTPDVFCCVQHRQLWGCVGHIPGLSAPAALLLLPWPHPCCLFVLRKLVAYHSHLMQLFKDMLCVPKCWMASFHLIWFIELKCIIRLSLPVLLLFALFMKSVPEIWIVLETEVVAVTAFLLHSHWPVLCIKHLPWLQPGER